MRKECATWTRRRGVGFNAPIPRFSNLSLNSWKLAKEGFSHRPSLQQYPIWSRDWWGRREDMVRMGRLRLGLIVEEGTRLGLGDG